MTEPIEAGEVFVVTYPFTRSEHFEEGFSPWKPGVRHENTYDGGDISLADGVGAQVLTAVALFKPGRYPERIFYTRQWRDPSGVTFGKTKLRMTTVSAFRRLIKGFRYHYEIDRTEQQTEAA